MCCSNCLQVLFFWFLSFNILGRLPIRVLTIDFIFFSLLPNSANFSRHPGRWRHLLRYTIQILLWSLSNPSLRHTLTHYGNIIFILGLAHQNNGTGSYISQKSRKDTLTFLYYNFGLYEMVVFNILYISVSESERPFALILGSPHLYDVLSKESIDMHLDQPFRDGEYIFIPEILV